MSTPPQIVTPATNATAAGAGGHIRFFGAESARQTLPELNDVGGKGINLCKLCAAGFPVPPGFVITTHAYRLFVESNGLAGRIVALAASIDAEDMQSLDRISAKIRELFVANPMPVALDEEMRAAYPHLRDGSMQRVAVRSSATAEDLPEASFAGQQDTYLNICGPDAVAKAVKSCWGSLWTSRAIAYRAKQATPLEGLAMAVVVQEMAAAEVSGIMFTANPVTGENDDIVINATWGLGEAIVGGQVTPDTVVVGKAADDIKEVIVSEKTVMTVMTSTGTEETEIHGEHRTARVLSDAQARELAEIGRRIEKYYGTAQDIEWALAHGHFAMLQSRPVRGLDVLQDAQVARQEEIARLKKIAGEAQTVWVIHNLSETLATPTPLTWDIVRHFMSGDGGFGQMYRDFGYQPSPDICREGFLDLICGRIYTDPRRMAKLFWGSAPLEYDMKEILADRDALERPPTKLNLQQGGQWFFLHLPKLFYSMWRCSRTMARLRAVALDRFEKQILPPYLAFIKESRAADLSKLATRQLLEELDRRRRVVLLEFGNESLKPAFFGGLAEGQMRMILVQLMGDQAGQDLTRMLTTGLENDSTVEQNVALHRVAHGQLPAADFLEEFGHRAVNEMELAQPRWREEPQFIQRMLGNYRQPGVPTPQQRHAQTVASRHKAQAELPQRLAEYGGSAQRENIEMLAREAQALLPYRERGKHYLMMGYETIRLVLVELSRRWNLGRDLFFLKLEELPCYQAQRDSFKPRIAARKLRWQAHQKLKLADVIDSRNLDGLGKPAPRVRQEGVLHLSARPIASGVSRGIARIVFDPATAGDLGPGYILVCPSTDPGWTPLFVNARGLVVERGGVLSHGAIVARDFGIPAVVCENATTLIANGMVIEVDGTQGIISAVK